MSVPKSFAENAPCWPFAGRNHWTIVAIALLMINLTALRTLAQTTETHLIQSDPPLQNANFGGAVDISGNIVAVGAWQENNFDGAVYLFDRTTGEQIARLVPDSGIGEDLFGSSVAMYGNILIVGANAYPRKGRCRVLVRPDNSPTTYSTHCR